MRESEGLFESILLDTNKLADRNCPLTDADKEANRRKSSVRSKVKHLYNENVILLSILYQPGLAITFSGGLFSVAINDNPTQEATMETFDAITQRRSVKNYDPAHQMTEAETERLLSAALLSPTSFNMQNWRFVLVRDAQLRREIRAVSMDQAQVTDASLLIVMCADLKAWEKQPARYWRNAPPAFLDFMLPAIDGYYRGRDQVARDEAMRSCGIAAQTLMLAAKSMGYDSCPMIGFDFDAVGKMINLPAGHVITMFVAIGKSMQAAQPRGGQLALDEVLIHDRF